MNSRIGRGRIVADDEAFLGAAGHALLRDTRSRCRQRENRSYVGGEPASTVWDQALLREYLPKGHRGHRRSNLPRPRARELNNRPRRILGYRTPAEVIANLLATSIVTTG
jgi:hypothetical protein